MIATKTPPPRLQLSMTANTITTIPTATTTTAIPINNYKMKKP